MALNRSGPVGSSERTRPPGIPALCRTTPFFAMSDSTSPTNKPRLSVAAAGLLLSDPTRWQILQELAKGQPLPVHELARRLGRPREVVSKHMSVLRRLEVAEPGFGWLYALVPAYRPAPGATEIDFGSCTVRLESQSSGA